MNTQPFDNLGTQPFVSVIVPVYNGGDYLDRCLDALFASSYESYEIIVVDDASTDDSAEICRQKGVAVFHLPRQSGPAAARNYGAQKARGDILFFVDSDVVVERETVARLAADFMGNPRIAAVFGSYDDSPAASGVVSQFRNLLHHFVHQNSDRDAKTFWAGCGAVYKEVFWKMRGFDGSRYSRPSIEDIELGLRMRKAGYGILLDKELTVKHLKSWKWRSWLKTDIFQRAVPWSRLILESGFLPRDLNLQTSHRVSAALSGCLALMPFLIVADILNIFNVGGSGDFLLFFSVLTAALLFLNRTFYTFLYKKRGMKFMLLAVPLHFLYYFYSGMTFAACWALHKLRMGRSALRAY